MSPIDSLLKFLTQYRVAIGLFIYVVIVLFYVRNEHHLGCECDRCRKDRKDDDERRAA